MQRVTVHVYGQAVCWQELSSPIEAKGKKKIIFLDRWRISLFQRKSFSKPTAIRMPTTLCLAPELSGKLSTVLRFNHYISLQSFASCVCHYWLYLVWKTFSCTWQFLEGIAAFACFWRPVCFKHWEDDNFGSQNKCKNPLFFPFPLSWPQEPAGCHSSRAAVPAPGCTPCTKLYRAQRLSSAVPPQWPKPPPCHQGPALKLNQNGWNLLDVSSH